MSESQICKIQQYSAILWPAFLVSGVANAVFFSLFDPHDFLTTFHMSRLAAYSIGFFFLWFTTSVSAVLTAYFLKPCHTVNRNITGKEQGGKQ